ncbi:MAG: invasion associated locus B family protein [Rhodothalassiaceae bacterium]
MRLQRAVTAGGPTMMVLAMLLAVFFAPMAARAADKTDLIGSYRDWDAYTLRKQDGELLCYMVSVPKSWAASRKGVRRGDIYITVTHRPKAKVRDQVNIVVGYPFKEGSEARAVIDGKTRFKLFTQGDGAWLYTQKEDSAMVRAMRRGGTLVVTGTSSRGTRTTDRYSLLGFTAAHNAISRACGL